MQMWVPTIAAVRHFQSSNRMGNTVLIFEPSPRCPRLHFLPCLRYGAFEVCNPVKKVVAHGEGRHVDRPARLFVRVRQLLNLDRPLVCNF